MKHAITSGDVFWKALNQLLPLAAFPALFLVFIIPVFIYDIYYSFVTPIPGENLICVCIYCYVEFKTSAVTLIVHISVARLHFILHHFSMVRYILGSCTCSMPVLQRLIHTPIVDHISL